MVYQIKTGGIIYFIIFGTRSILKFTFKGPLLLVLFSIQMSSESYMIHTESNCYIVNVIVRVSDVVGLRWVDILAWQIKNKTKNMFHFPNGFD